ncbi:MAG: metallopeptidase family protein [Chloroflexi bacterium]|nr:metallopeptidase family protein [Chloroflexota bacterium]
MPKRRRGSARLRRSSGSSFERLVDRALAGIPSPFREHLREVAIVIEDEPSAEQLRENGLEGDDALYGLYEGVPRTEWGADLAIVANKISLFRLPLEEDFPEPDDLADEVRATVIHELAHHLGIDDDRLDELGLG